MDGTSAERCLIALQRCGQQRRGLEFAAGHRFPDMGGGFSGPAVGERIAELEQRRRQDRNGQRNRLAGQGRDTARQLGGQVFRRQRQAGQAAYAQRRGLIDHPRQQLTLQGDRRLEMWSCLADDLPSSAGRFEQIFTGKHWNRYIRHELPGNIASAILL
jgi:hypothetical protein